MPTLKRILSLLFAGCATILAQTPAALPPAQLPAIPLTANGKPLTFDIVSFRRTEKPGSSRVDLPEDGDSIAYHGQTVQRMIYFAYLTMGPKVIDMPKWVSNDLYDFQAKVAAEDVPIWQKMDLQSKRLMVRAVLEDALKLKVHQNDRPEAVYDLIVSGKPKLKEYVEGETKTLPNGEVLKDTNYYYNQDSFEVYYQGYTMQKLADNLIAHHITDKDIIDKTGLTGKYDFTLTVVPANLPQEILDRIGGGPIYVEIQKIGLKLVPSKAISPGVIIDHVERPPEN